MNLCGAHLNGSQNSVDLGAFSNLLQVTKLLRDYGKKRLQKNCISQDQVYLFVAISNFIKKQETLINLVN